jgi:hypothetical protein
MKDKFTSKICHRNQNNEKKQTLFGFQNFEKASIHSTNNPHNYVVGSGTWI